MELEKKLVKLRKQSGMSQLEVAEELSVSRQAISRWEVGSAVPSSDNLRLLSKLYHVSLDYLMDDTAEEPEQMSARGRKLLRNSSRQWENWVECLLLSYWWVRFFCSLSTTRATKRRAGQSENCKRGR